MSTKYSWTIKNCPKCGASLDKMSPRKEECKNCGEDLSDYVRITIDGNISYRESMREIRKEERSVAFQSFLYSLFGLIMAVLMIVGVIIYLKNKF